MDKYSTEKEALIFTFLKESLKKAFGKEMWVKVIPFSGPHYHRIFYRYEIQVFGELAILEFSDDYSQEYVREMLIVTIYQGFQSSIKDVKLDFEGLTSFDSQEQNG